MNSPSLTRIAAHALRARMYHTTPTHITVLQPRTYRTFR